MAASSDRLQHKIAAQAAKFVSEVKSGPADNAEYRSFCEGFPTLLRTAGLLQTLMFLEAKKEAKKGHPHGTLLGHLKSQFATLGLIENDKIDLAVKVATLPTPEYMTWTRMADKIAYWHKRFAQALLKDKD
jgi:CRISPR type III-B/RAMP module-associated protein Cmr5